MADLREKFSELKKEYVIDRKELGKVLFIISASIFVVSAYSVYTVGQTLDDVSQAQETLRGSTLIVESEGFQDTLETLDQRGMTVDGEDMSEILDEMEFVSVSQEQVEEAEQRLENSRTNYQWLTLLGILGMVAGALVIYI